MKRSSLCILLGAALVAGCAADATGTGGASTHEETAPASDPAAGTLLARVDTPDGRSVAFFEMAPGSIRAEESGPRGTKPSDEVTKASTFIDAYRALASGGEVPAAMTGALDRFKGAATAREIAAPEPTSSAAPMRPMNTGAENWFQQNFCTDRSTAYCTFSNSGSASVPWSLASGYTEIALDDPSDETSLRMTDYLWENVGGTWKWVADYLSAPIAPNTWMSERWFNASQVYRYASVAGGSGPGGIAPVGLTSEVRNAYFDATWAGQWEFTGGYFVNDSLVNISVVNYLVGESPTSTQATVSGGSFSQLMPVWCASYPGTANITFKAVGAQTGETAYATAPENGCW